MTELVVNLASGISAATAWSELSASFGSSFTAAPLDKLHPGFESSFRQNTAQWSMQISYNSDQSTLNIDIDPWNPYSGSAVGFLGHASNVLNHMLTGDDTDYATAASNLGISVQNCSP